MFTVNNKESLVGKVVVITGASSGVGRAAAIEFAKYKTKLVLAARRIDVLNQLVIECEALGATAIAIKTDVTETQSMLNLALHAEEFGGWVDIWINNAGVMAAGEFNDTPVEVHDHVIKTNLMGFIHGAHAIMPVFKKQGTGILINNISIGGFYPTPYAVGYSASKFGLRGFSDALKGELHKWPLIYICDLYPAFLDTPGIQHAANYTGKVLKPAPPVYDPVKVGRAMVQVAINPKKSTMVGAASYALKAGYFFVPAIMRFITAKVMETYFSSAADAVKSSGNVFEPVQSGTTIDGGWRASSKKKQLTIALGAGVLITSFMLLQRSIKKTNL